MDNQRKGQMARELSMSDAFFQELVRVVEVNMGNEYFGAEELATEMGLSRSQIHRKLKSITGQSTSQFIREIRLRKAHELLEDQVGTASEIAYRVGFNSPTYFHKCFKDYFGYPPGSVKTPGLEQPPEIEDYHYINIPSANRADLFGKMLSNQRMIILVIIASFFITLTITVVYYLPIFNLSQVKSVTAGLETTGNQIPSIAVLPFTDMSSEEGNEYFGYGLAEELINALSKLKKLRVAARTSSFSFQGKQVNASEIGEKLNVSYLLQGSVRKEGAVIRISVELIDTKEGFQVWSESYDRRIDRVLELQDEITQTILHKLKIQLSGQENVLLADHGTQNTDAYIAYLKGRYHWNKRAPEDLLRAEEYFTLAVDQDSLFASAYSGLADTYTITIAYGLRDPEQIALRALNASTKALAIDPELADAYVSKAFIHLLMERDWDGADKSFRQAMLLNPDYPTAHHWYAGFYLSRGRIGDALDEIKKALILDPLSPSINTGYGHVLYMARKYDETLDQLNKTLELTPHMYTTHFILGNVLLEKNLAQEALAAYQTAYQLAETSLTIAALGRAYGLLGNRGKALEMMDVLEKKAEREFVPSIFFAWVYLGLGEKDTAIDWLEKAAEEPGILYTLYLAIYPFYDELQKTQRFINILNALDMIEVNRQL